MKQLYALYQRDRARQQRYFQDAAEEITKRNLFSLKILGLSVCGLTLLFCLLSPLIIPGWKMRLPHFLLFPAGLLMYFSSDLCQRRKGRGAQALCLLAEAVVFFITAMIDLSPASSPNTFIPLLLTVLPVLFTVPTRRAFQLICGTTAAYLAAIYFLKSDTVIAHDVFTTLVGFVFFFPLFQIINRIQVQDYEIQSKYQRLSTRDMLSGILNKRSWEAAVQDYLAECQPNVSCALLVLDIDNFKGINDRFGHYTGDEFLHFVGESLLGIFRVSDLVGRFGGDEFVVLIQGAVSQEALEEKCSLIQARFAQAPLEATVSCSIGGTLVREQPVEFVSLFRQADRALYAAKRAGKARFVLHDYQ